MRTASGTEHRYDHLIVALGATIKPRYEHAITVDDRRIDDLLHGLIQDVEDGYVKRLAVVVPPRMGWPLPAYELALMTATRAEDSNIEMEITILTPEDAPLALFGEGASQGVRDLLDARRIEVITSAYCEIPRTGQIEISPGDRSLTVDRVIALPELVGPALEGLPEAENGFIPVDEHCRDPRARARSTRPAMRSTSRSSTAASRLRRRTRRPGRSRPTSERPSRRHRSNRSSTASC